MFVSVSTMPVGDDIEKLKEYVKQIEQFADFLHCDICDGEYNQTKCFSHNMASQINKMTTLPLDCHLMTKNAIKYAQEYMKCGANIITAQVESFNNNEQIIDFINFVKSKKTLVGLSIEPETEIKAILPYIEKLDICLVMGVRTGASGQKFNENVLSKIEYLSNLRAHQNYNYLIEVDGGIDDQTSKLVRKIGADIVVSGNYIYNSENKAKAVEILKK